MLSIVGSRPRNMSARNGAFTAHFEPPPQRADAQHAAMPSSIAKRVLSCLPLGAVAAAAIAQSAPPSPVDAPLAAQLRGLARDSAHAALDAAANGARVEVELGQLDPRLTLAPCQKIEPYLPAGARLAGRTRVGLRCTQGPTRWNVTLPVTVKIFARSLVAGMALPAGTVLREHHLAEAEVDLAERADPAVGQPEAVVGRTLARPLAAGEALRRGDLKPRQWFAAGDTVRIVAQGAGFSVTADGQALGPGLEGQPARVRTDSGRIVTGLPAGERRVEVPL
jgi:flagella basal body P-ring formation protein FlgA